MHSSKSLKIDSVIAGEVLGCLAKAMPKANVRPEVCVGRFFYSYFYGAGKWLDKNCYPQAQTKLGKKQMVPGVA